MKGIHMFNRDHTTQVTSCRPWSSQLHTFSSLVKKMKAYLEERRSNANPFHPTHTFSDRPTTPPPMNSQAPQKRKARDIKKRSRNHQASRRQYKVRRIENPSTSAPRTAATTIIIPTLPTTSNSINPVIVMSTWPTNSSTTTNLFVSSYSSKTLRSPNVPKPQTFNQTPRSWPRPHTPAPFTDWSSDDNCNGINQKEKISKVQRRKQRQLAEEERGRKEEQNTTSLKSNSPDLIDLKPSPSYTSSHKEDTPILDPEKEKKETIRKLDVLKFKTTAARKPTSSQPIPPAAETATSTTANTLVATAIPSAKNRDCPAHFVLNLPHTPHH